MPETADTWDSYFQTLDLLLTHLKIYKVLEYGSGKSTLTLGHRVRTLDSVEHNPRWVNQYPPKNVNVIFEPSPALYPFVTGRYDNYDLIFVDGIERPKCIEVAKEFIDEDGVVLVHDAEREAYQQSYDLFKYKIFTDNGHTVTLTNSDKTKAILDKWLK